MLVANVVADGPAAKAGIKRNDIILSFGGQDVADLRHFPRLVANARVSPSQRALAQHILDAVGLTRWLEDERLMDTVTALSGSGPAYFFALTEALEDAAVAKMKVGIGAN